MKCSGSETGSSAPEIQRLAAEFERYAHRGRDAADAARLFLAMLEAGSGDPFQRAHPGGHFTGSALVLSADGRRTLLTHHRKLNRWLQPGGHADGDRDLARVALREAEEETGLAELSLDRDSGILDLDRHWIPERPGEAGHWHYDVRYLVRAGSNETFHVTAESNALAWWPLEQVIEDAQFDVSLQRMAMRCLTVGTGA